MPPLDPEVARELDRFDRRLSAIEMWPMKTAAIEVELSGIKEDVRFLRMEADKRSEQHRREQEAQAKERKSDRRWMATTALTTAGLVITAMAILLNAFGGSP